MALRKSAINAHGRIVFLRRQSGNTANYDDATAARLRRMLALPAIILHNTKPDILDLERIEPAERIPRLPITMPQPLVFINYRNCLSRPTAVIIADELRRRLGQDAVFLDSHERLLGEDFETRLLSGLERANVLLALISPEWPGLMDASGEMRRLEDEKDWVRREIEYFLARPTEKKVIPLLITGRIKMPAEKALPGLLSQLPKLNCEVIRNQYEKHDIGKVVEQLCDPRNNLGFKEIGTRPPPPPPPPPPTNPTIAAYLERLATDYEHLTLLGMGRSLQIELSIDEAYVSLSAVVQNQMETEPIGEKGVKVLREVDETRETKTIVLDEVFKEAGKRKKRGIVVLGEPGAGKTTVARKLAWQLASGKTLPEEIGLPAGVVPVLLKFRNLKTANISNDDEHTSGLRQFLIQETRATHAADQDQDPGEVLWNQNKPGLLWILDGLDEVADPKQRKLVSDWIQNAIIDRPSHWFFVTSRFAGYFRIDALLGAKFLEVHVQPLSNKELEGFIHKWYAAAFGKLHGGGSETEAKAKTQSTNLIEILRKPEYQTGRMREMCCNPLMLTILCIVYHEERKLPTKRAELYAHCVRVLLEYWRRDLYVESGGTWLEPYDQIAAQSVLSKLAWWLHQKSDRRTAPLIELAKQATDALAVLGESSGLGRDGTQFLNRMRDEAGIIAMTGDGEGECGFLHLSFQEYLAAFYAATNGFGKELARNATTSWWREVALLSLRQNEGFCKTFFQEVISQSLVTADPAFVDQCLNEALFVDSGTFMEPLRSKQTNPEKQAAILRVIKNQLWPELVDVCGELVKSADRTVRDLAEEFLARHESATSANPTGQSGTGDRITINESSPSAKGPPSTPKPQEIWVEPVSGVTLVYIPPGEFVMGSERGDIDERPVHRVRITCGFWLGKYPVTNAEYQRFMTANPGKTEAPRFWNERRFNQPQQPVVGVTWNEVAAYCEWMGGRLPTEAEWEYACRAGTESEYSFGDDSKMLGDYAWYRGNSGGQTQPVGTKKPNPWGLYDMQGNVWEWCADGKREYKHSASAIDGPLGSARVFRGGCWVNTAGYCRLAYRDCVAPAYRGNDLGFRVAWSSIPVQAVPSPGAQPAAQVARSGESGR